MAKDQSRNSVNQQIDENLRRVYNEALHDQVPDKFMQLIRQLQDSEKRPVKQDEDGN
jgi:hypothetical protein